jgi:hypothetical protein
MSFIDDALQNITSGEDFVEGQALDRIINSFND